MAHGRNIGPHKPARALLRGVVALLAAALGAALGAPAHASPPELRPTAAAPAAAVPREILVRFSPGIGASARAGARRDADARFADRLPLAGLELVRVEPGTSTAEAVEQLEHERGVLYAEPNRYRSATRLPTDPYFALLWGLHNIGQPVNGSTGTLDADIDGPEAWDLSIGDPAVAVAIVDSGVDAAHPDLASNIWTNPGETGAGRRSNGVDDDGNGYVDDASGWDWVGSDANPADLHGHGTHVAGTVAARGDNATGVTGVAWRAGLMPLRVLNESGNGTVADAIEAYAYAGGEGARVVNASLGGSSFSRAEHDTIRAIPGALFVVAAGNDGRNNDTVPQYPCNYELPNVVCVAATGQRDALAGFSNYGAATVDLAAPGVNTLSTYPGGYAYSNGTSMATPHVSGAAALVFAHRAGSTPASVRAALLAGVDVLPSLAGRTVTGGRMNAYRALTGSGASGSAPPPPSSPGPAAAPDRSAPQITVSVRRRQRLRTVLRRGVRVRVTCSENCRADARALIGRRAGRREGFIHSALILAGRGTVSLAAFGPRTIRISLKRSAKRRLARARRPLLRLRVSASDLAGNSRATTRRIRVTRR